MKELIERFYNSIRTRGEPPIPYREIIFTARIMDEIFAQIYPAQKQAVNEHLSVMTGDAPLPPVSVI
jgi:hypothetical protein